MAIRDRGSTFSSHLISSAVFGNRPILACRGVLHVNFLASKGRLRELFPEPSVATRGDWGVDRIFFQGLLVVCLSGTIADCRVAWTRRSDFATRMVVVAGCMGCSLNRFRRSGGDGPVLGKVTVGEKSPLHQNPPPVARSTGFDANDA